MKQPELVERGTGTDILVLAVMFVLVNLAVDILYAFVDPRIRYGSS